MLQHIHSPKTKKKQKNLRCRFESWQPQCEYLNHVVSSLCQSRYGLRHCVDTKFGASLLEVHSVTWFISSTNFFRTEMVEAFRVRVWPFAYDFCIQGNDLMEWWEHQWIHAFLSEDSSFNFLKVGNYLYLMMWHQFVLHVVSFTKSTRICTIIHIHHRTYEEAESEAYAFSKNPTKIYHR